MGFLESIYEKAKANKKVVAVPECDNVRMMRAAVNAKKEGLAEPVFVGKAALLKELAEKENIDISGIRIADTEDEAFKEELLSRYEVLPKRAMGRGYISKVLKKPLYMALVLEALGDVDCTYGGLDTTTLEFVMAATGILGLAEGVSIPSGMTFIEFMNDEGEVIKLLGTSDGAINTEPDAEATANIAVASCDTFKTLTGEDARCAILSYSTDGSGNSPTVKRAQEARDLAQAKRPDLMIDGEFQVDTALLPRVAERKMKRASEVAGKANVLIFPDAAAENIGAKFAQMFSHSRGYGPVYQGFAKPVLDCSRGITDDRLYDNFAFCSVMAANQMKK